MKDSEILERLIYRAYVAPATRTLDDAAFVPLAAALRLYARIYAAEEEIEKKELIAAAFGSVCDGDACPVEYPEPRTVPEPDTEPEPEPKPADTHTHTAGTNDGEAGTPAGFAGYGAGEKREIYAELMAFVATHGLGARRRIAETSDGVLTLAEVQDMTDAKRLPLSKWRVARAAMQQIDEEKNQNGG